MRTFEKYIWLLNTIKRYQPVKLSAIDAQWQVHPNNNDKSDLPYRTFKRWCEAIDDVFGVEIECNGFNEYFIKESYSTQDETLKNWMIQTYSINNILNDDTSLRSRVIFDRVPSGDDFLVPIIDSMKSNVVLILSYKGFQDNVSNDYTIEPYLVKQVNRRWYVLGRDSHTDSLHMFCLDRITGIQTTDNHFTIPKKFNAKEYFKGTVGISADHNIPIETILLKVSIPHLDYILTLPIHESHEVVETHADYAILQYQVRPTFEFFQQIFLGGDMIEILSPSTVRKKAADWLKAMCNNYN